VELYQDAVMHRSSWKIS